MITGKNLRKLIVGVVSFLLFGAMNVYAAPELNITSVTCRVVKESGNKYHLFVDGSYNASSSSSNDYKINGYRFKFTNNGGQQLRDTGLITLATPQTVFNQPYYTYETRTFASNLQNVEFYVYNGTSQKGYAPTTCSKNF